MGAFWSQTFFIPKPTLTEHNLPDQSGRVFLITGGNSGVGYELVKILYQHNGIVYLAGRSEERCMRAIDKLKSLSPASAGRLEFLHLDLGDLSTIKASAESFKNRETRLDFLCNNAGILNQSETSKSAQVRCFLPD